MPSRVVATVSSGNMDLRVRGAPGTTTRFRTVTMNEALAARAELAELRAQIWG